MSLKALKNAHGPEAGATTDISDMAVLLELFRLHIVAWCEAATGTIRIIVGKDLVAECDVVGMVPDVEYPPSCKISEDFRLHRLLPAAGKRAVMMPEKVTRRDVAFPRHKRPSILHKTAVAFFAQGNLGKFEVESGGSGDFTGLGEGRGNFFQSIIDHAQQLFHVHEYVVSFGFRFHLLHKVDYPLFLGISGILPAGFEVVIDIEPLPLRFTPPGFE